MAMLVSYHMCRVASRQHTFLPGSVCLVSWNSARPSIGGIGGSCWISCAACHRQPARRSLSPMDGFVSLLYARPVANSHGSRLLVQLKSPDLMHACSAAL